MTAKLDQAMNAADDEAIEARHIIIGMRSQHANLVVVLNALRWAVRDADWADFTDVIDSLTSAARRLDNVYATTDEQRAELAREDGRAE